MRRQIARIVMIVTLAAAGTAWANIAPRPPRPTPTPPPPTQPSAQRDVLPTSAKPAPWSAAGGVMLGIGAAALLSAGGLYLSRRRNQ